MSLSERASAYLADEVRKAQLELDAATGQVREAEARRDAAQVKVSVLKQALGGEAIGNQTSLFASTDLTAGAAAQMKGIGQAIGFRATIRTVLADAHKGLRPMEIFALVQERGIVYTGKTNPGTRITNELRRMVEERQARRRGKLYYAVHTDGAAAKNGTGVNAS